jgi:cytochrome c oxidase assembly factor CtaG
VIDQQHAGAIMWVLGGFLMVLVVMWTSIHALLEEERRQQARDRHAATAGGAR